MKIRLGLIIILSLFSSISSLASTANYMDDIDAFFKLLKSGKSSEAADKIYESNPYVTAIPDAILNVKTQLSGLPTLVGGINAIENVGSYYVGESLAHITYIVTYDRQPLRFEFQYFKVRDGWRISSFSFDDTVFDDVNKAARQAVMQ